MGYQTGEKTLKNIGLKIGNVTPTMVNRLFVNSMEKIKILTNNKPLEYFEIEEDRAFLDFISKIRLEACDEFINLFEKVNYDIYDFLYCVKRKQYITDIDIKLLNEKEIYNLVEIKFHLENNNKSLARNILLSDIEKDDNINTIYQNIISKIAFPNRKRGRPRKD